MTATRVVLSIGVALSLPRLGEVEGDVSGLLVAWGITVFCALFVSLGEKLAALPRNRACARSRHSRKR